MFRKSKVSDTVPAPGEVRRMTFPNSLDGIRYTVDRMALNIKEGRRDPLVIATARKIASMALSSNSLPFNSIRTMIQLEAIHAWCRDNFVYLNDPVGIELIQTPNRMLRELEIPPLLEKAIWKPIRKALGGKKPKPKMSGDSDEAVIISLSLAAALGIDPLRIELGGYDEVVHYVWGSACVGGQWKDMDILCKKFGSIHPSIQRISHLDIIMDG